MASSTEEHLLAQMEDANRRLAAKQALADANRRLAEIRARLDDFEHWSWDKEAIIAEIRRLAEGRAEGDE